MSRFESFVLRLTVDDEIGQMEGQVTHVRSQATSYFKSLANLEKVILQQLQFNQPSNHDGSTNGHTASPTNPGRTRNIQGDNEDSSLDGPLVS